jgi:hypothetical protein
MMEPIGLTLKATCKKYGPTLGELMLIHLCVECTAISIKRIAADDDPQTVFTVFEGLLRLDLSTRVRVETNGIHVMDEADRDTAHTQLFGLRSDPVEICFKGSALE